MRYDELKKAAQEAMPGPWTAHTHGRITAGKFHQYTNGTAQKQIAMMCVTAHSEELDETPEYQTANTRYVAQAHPTAILELLASHAALEAENAALREKLTTAEARTVLTDEFTRVGASIARKADRIIVASAISAEWADRLISASAAPAAQEDALDLPPLPDAWSAGFSSDQMRHYARQAIDASRREAYDKGRAEGVGQAAVVNRLMEVCAAAYEAMDGAEEIANRQGGEDAEYVIQGRDFDALSNAMDLVESLPDDQPGIVMGPAAKAAWALRAAPPASTAQQEGK